MLLNLNLKNDFNIGDAVCAPCQYFDLGGIHLDLNENHPELNKDDVLIIGGGAVSSRAEVYQTKAKKILWGAGISIRNDMSRANHFHNSKGFELYGTRDYGFGNWVSCPSCMSYLFNNVPEPTQDFVYYGHADFEPMELNNDCMDFEKILMYLSKGETIVTSSYHGMYWGYLLGRKVIIKPYSSKFFTLPWEVSTEKGISYKNALSEARESNLSFYEKVKVYI